MRISYNLPVTFEITLGECKHGNIKEVDPHAVGHPQYYECLDCGSKFPVIGDSDLWDTGVRVTNIKVKQS